MSTLNTVTVKFLGSQPVITINDNVEDFADDMERYGQTGNILVAGLRGTQLPEGKADALKAEILSRWGELETLLNSPQGMADVKHQISQMAK